VADNDEIDDTKELHSLVKGIIDISSVPIYNVIGSLRIVDYI
jgi:hypothetical protein